MKENQVSLGVLAATYYRAYHAIHDDPKIFYDHHDICSCSYGFFPKMVVLEQIPQNS